MASLSREEMLALEAERRSQPFFQRTAEEQVNQIKAINEARKADPVGTGFYKDMISTLFPTATMAGRALSNLWNKISEGDFDTKSSSISSSGAPQAISDSVSAVSNAVSSGTHSAYQVASNPSIASVDGAPISSAVRNISDPELRANAFNEMMSNSAHQREVQDLIKAGLNPILSARYGGAGSSGYETFDSGSGNSGSGSSGNNKYNSFFGFQLKPFASPKNGLQMAYNTFVQNSNALEGVLRSIFKE